MSDRRLRSKVLEWSGGLLLREDLPNGWYRFTLPSGPSWSCSAADGLRLSDADVRALAKGVRDV